MIRIRGSDLTTAVNRVLDVVGRDSTIFFEADPDKNVLDVIGVNDLNRVRKRLTAEVQKRGKFALAGELACRSFAHRDFLTLSLKDTTVKFAAEKAPLKGEVYAVQYDDNLNDKLKGLKIKNATHTVDKSVGDFLFKKLRKVALKPSYESGSLIAMVQATKKRLQVAVADGYHGALMEEPVILAAPLAFNIPISYLDQIEKLVGQNGSFKLHQDDNCMYVLTDDLEMSLPLVGGGNVSFQDIADGMANFTNFTSSAIVAADGVKKALKTLEAMYDPESAEFVLAVEKKTVTLRIKSKFGKMQESIDAEECTSDKNEIIMDWLSFRDIIEKVRDKITIKVFDRLACMVEFKDGVSRVSYMSKGKSET